MVLKKIQKYLLSTININFIKIYNNSSFHHHSKTDLTHIKIIIVSNDFIHQKLVDRHRMVFSKLLKIKKIYSLSLDTYTLDEWKNKKCQINNHAQCLKNKKNIILN